VPNPPQGKIQDPKNFKKKLILIFQFNLFLCPSVQCLQGKSFKRQLLIMIRVLAIVALIVVAQMTVCAADEEK